MYIILFPPFTLPNSCPPLLRDHFLLKFNVVSQKRDYCTSSSMSKVLQIAQVDIDKISAYEQRAPAVHHLYIAMLDYIHCNTNFFGFSMSSSPTVGYLIIFVVEQSLHFMYYTTTMKCRHNIKTTGMESTCFLQTNTELMCSLTKGNPRLLQTKLLQ